LQNVYFSPPCERLARALLLSPTVSVAAGKLSRIPIAERFTSLRSSPAIAKKNFDAEAKDPQCPTNQGKLMYQSRLN